MNRIWISTAVIAAAATAARADGKDELVRQAGEQLGVYYKWVTALTRTPTSSEVLPPGAQCDADVAAWKAKGVEDGDRIFSYDFNAHPKAKDNTIPLSEMKSVCIAYRALYAPYKLDYDLRMFDATLMKIRDGVVKPGDSVLTASVIATMEQQGDPAACKATVAAATAADPTMLTRGISGKLTLTEFETKVCDPLAKLHPQFIADARAELAKATAKTLAPYTAAGIGGDKLALLAKYDGVSWRLAGGAVTDAPDRLAKASVLFQWLEAPDRDDDRYVVHTIRKYRFKGNDLVDTTEKQYRRKVGAAIGNVFR